MVIYECSVCGHKFDEDKEGIKFDDLPDDWKCPTCGTKKTYFKIIKEISFDSYISKNGLEEVSINDYLKEFSKEDDEIDDIQYIAKTGKSIIEPMKTRKPIISWDDILFKGAQLSKIPINSDENVNIQTIIGPKAKQPLVIESPVYITHMSYGALSKEIKIALAIGSAKVKTAMCSGEGGVLKKELEESYKYIFEYVPNEYSFKIENLEKVDAIEIKIGQSVKPGMGGHLPGEKVTEEIARVRGKEPGKDIVSPARFIDINNKEELKSKVDFLREKSNGKPIGIKIAAGSIKDDLEIAVYANPDFITIDGRGGATGSVKKVIKDSTSIPTLFALHRARKYLDEKEIKDISLIITGGLRISSDFAKAIAMGADAIAIGTSALIACACQQYRICNTGNCPVGITTQDDKLRSRLNIDLSAKRLENFLKVINQELKDFARLTGNNNIHNLSISDLCTTNSEISNHTDIKHV